MKRKDSFLWRSIYSSFTRLTYIPETLFYYYATLTPQQESSSNTKAYKGWFTPKVVLSTFSEIWPNEITKYQISQGIMDRFHNSFFLFSLKQTLSIQKKFNNVWKNLFLSVQWRRHTLDRPYITCNILTTTGITLWKYITQTIYNARVSR